MTHRNRRAAPLPLAPAPRSLKGSSAHVGIRPEGFRTPYSSILSACSNQEVRSHQTDTWWRCGSPSAASASRQPSHSGGASISSPSIQRQISSDTPCIPESTANRLDDFHSSYPYEDSPFRSRNGIRLQPDAPQQHPFMGEALLSYRPAPGTVFFLGYSREMLDDAAFRFAHCSLGRMASSSKRLTCSDYDCGRRGSLTRVPLSAPVAR